ncbi:MAG: hypothetical protein KC442_19690, partial [Thermomicrobiales bacterium]|nr:hypothetical protein [Thermomicrobiales bacterium]
IITEVVTHTLPLNEYESHLFTVNFWGVQDFQMARAKDLKAPTTDSAPIMFEPQDPSLPSRQQVGRIVATRYTVPYTGLRVAPQVAASGKIQTPVSFQRWDGGHDHGIPIFPPAMEIADFHITLRYVPMERTETDNESALLLLGGFHAPLGDVGPVRGICINYAQRDDAEWERLVRERGTVDLAIRRQEAHSQ